jgi:uncharacterized protein
MTAENGSQDARSSREWWANFRQLLDSQVEWPSEYLFKFIVPKRQLDEMKNIFDKEEQLVVRASSKGKYLSVTARVMVDSSDDVIAIYTAAGAIEGIISL